MGHPGGPGCTFQGYYHKVITTGRCMDVMMRIDGNIELIGASWSVGYTTDKGLAVDSFREWVGVGVSWNAKGVVQKTCFPLDGVTDNGSEVGNFDCAIPQPAPPGTMKPGTYRMGTIVWDTSAFSPWGTTGIYALVTDVDAFINGNVVNYNDKVVVGSHLINMIPEPGTASLLGLGLVGLILAARRRRG